MRFDNPRRRAAPDKAHSTITLLWFLGLRSVNFRYFKKKKKKGQNKAKYTKPV